MHRYYYWSSVKTIVPGKLEMKIKKIKNRQDSKRKHRREDFDAEAMWRELYIVEQ